MIVGLTSLQAEAFRFVEAYIEHKGHSPSIAEITAAMDFTSKSHAHRVVTALIERGYLVKLPNRPRALAIADRRRDRPSLSREDEALLVLGAAAAGMDLSSYIRFITKGAA